MGGTAEPDPTAITPSNLILPSLPTPVPGPVGVLRRVLQDPVGNTLAIVVNVLGITRIVLYGRLVRAGELLRQQLLNSIRQHCIYPLNQDTEVCLSQLDEYGSAAGAAYGMLRGYFADGDQD